MYKHLTIDDFIQFDIYNSNKSKLIITNNKLKDNCNIYIYEIKKVDKLYYLYYFVDIYDYKKDNILIHYFINNIEKEISNKKDLNNEYLNNEHLNNEYLNNEYIGSYNTLNSILQYLNEQCLKNHKNHYFIYNSNKFKNSNIYYIQEIDKLIKK